VSTLRQAPTKANPSHRMKVWLNLAVLLTSLMVMIKPIRATVDPTELNVWPFSSNVPDSDTIV
jgi:hypothetical protein